MTTTDADLACITTDDLEWWLERIHELDWVFAVTYAEGAPHEYVNAGRTPGFTAEDCVRAARVIRTFGQPMKFYSTTRIYLTDAQGWKYWDMAGADVRESGIINRGRVEHVYGVQTAPRTVSGVASAYDSVATEWDRVLGATPTERTQLTELIGSLGDFTRKRVLDIGCGTGLPLDLGITQSVRYVGIDPSQGMLNALVQKHPHLTAVHAMTFGQALERRVLGGTRFDLVLALGGAGSYLSDAEFEGLRAHASGPIVVSAFAPGSLPAVGDLEEVNLSPARERLGFHASSVVGTVRTVGRFSVAVIEGG
jgi:hypothetical protein